MSLAGKIYKPFQWFYINDDADYAKYESFTFNAAYQIYLLTEEVKKLNKTKILTQPMFVALSEDDELIDTTQPCIGCVQMKICPYCIYSTQAFQQ